MIEMKHSHYLDTPEIKESLVFGLNDEHVLLVDADALVGRYENSYGPAQVVRVDDVTLTQDTFLAISSDTSSVVENLDGQIVDLQMLLDTEVSQRAYLQSIADTSARIIADLQILLIEARLWARWRTIGHGAPDLVNSPPVVGTPTLTVH